MPDLHCPSCAAHLDLNSFELTTKRKAELVIELDINCDLTVEDEVIEVKTEELTIELMITCWSCPWWGRIPLGDIELDVSINGFEELSKLLVAGYAEAPETAPVPKQLDYAPSYGGPSYPRRQAVASV